MQRLTTNQPSPASAQPSWKSLSFESSASHSAKYRPDVDGLRAIAVLGVLFFHSGLAAFQGGFVGVDIFYVISGYLITSLLVRDIEGNKFSIVAFYERRARRIFPALFSLLFFCIVATSVLFNPKEMSAFGETLLATTFFVSNLYFWKTAHPLGYFDNEVNSKPLLHTWSLSVEEQFYVAFPLLLFLLFRWAKSSVRIWLVLLTAVSFALNLWATQHKPVLAFYWFIPRAWELSIGALVAVKVLPPLNHRILREVAGVLGLAMLVSSLFIPVLNWAFPGYIALLPCVGSSLVIYAGEAGPSVAKALLSFRPLVFIGTISYSLYLWHWPVIVFSKHLPFHFSEQAEIAVVLVASIAFAFISFEYVERPFRGSRSPFSRRQIFAFGALASALTATFGAAAYLSHGLLDRYNPQSRQLVVRNLERMNDFDDSCANWKKEIHQVSDMNLCVLGSEFPHKVMFWGDSHVEQLWPALQQVFAEGAFRDRGVVLAVENGCLPDRHVNNTGDGFHCDAFAKYAMIRAKQDDIDAVFIGFSTWWVGGYDNFFCASLDGKCQKMLRSRDDATARFLADLSDEIRELQSQGKRVILCLPFPEYDRTIPEVEINNAVFGKYGLSVDAHDITSLSLRERVRAVAENTGAEIFDPREVLCRGQKCLSAMDGVSIYKDNSHLTPTGARVLSSGLRELLQRDAGIAETTPATRTAQQSPQALAQAQSLDRRQQRP